MDPPRIELGLPDCQPGVFPLDHGPVCSVDLMGVEPIAPTLQESVAASGMQAHWFFTHCFRTAHGSRSVRELNPVFLLTEEVCCRNTYRPKFISDPGWNRTIDFLDVTQASSPLDHGIAFYYYALPSPHTPADKTCQ